MESEETSLLKNYLNSPIEQGGMSMVSISEFINAAKNRPRPAAYWRPACCCVFPFFAKIRKFKMAAIFGEGKIF